MKNFVLLHDNEYCISLEGFYGYRIFEEENHKGVFFLLIDHEKCSVDQIEYLNRDHLNKDLEVLIKSLKEYDELKTKISLKGCYKNVPHYDSQGIVYGYGSFNTCTGKFE